MFKNLSYKEFKKLATAKRPVAVYREIPGDRLTPASAFRALGARTKGAALLESGLVGHLGRFSFLHLEVILEVEASGALVTLKEEGRERTLKTHPFDHLRELQAQTSPVSAHFLSSFTGGFIGYMGFGCAGLFENIPDRHRQDDSPADMVFRRYRDTVAFDHQTGKVVISSLSEPGRATHKAYDEAMSRIEAITKCFNNAPGLSGSKGLNGSKVAGIRGIEPDIRETMNDAAFKKIVEKAKRHIRAGDVFQVVLSRAFEVPVSAEPFDVYRALKLIGPSPFMFYLDMGDQVIVGASPEKLVSLTEGVMEICPLAGTRPRGNDLDDQEIEKDLINDPKERAEHMMLVDLARNDLGAISVPGSVKVRDLMKVQHFSHVMHITSTVEGILQDGRDAFDALQYAFPAGTLSGAPKIRAMEIIDDLETARRNVYGGTVCAINNAGNLNSCIVIRTMVLANGIATVRAGAGIVSESDPQKEADETRHKARSVLEAIVLAEGGLM